MLLVKHIERPDGLGFACVDLQRPSIRIIAHRHLSAHPEPAALRGGDFVPNPFCRHLTFELREGQQHVQRQQAHAGRRVKGLGDRYEGSTGGIQDIDDLRKVRQ